MADTEQQAPEKTTVTVTINGTEIEANPGELLIAAAERNGSETLRVGLDDADVCASPLPVRYGHFFRTHRVELELVKLAQRPRDGGAIAFRAGGARSHLDRERTYDRVCVGSRECHVAQRGCSLEHGRRHCGDRRRCVLRRRLRRGPGLAMSREGAQ